MCHELYGLSKDCHAVRMFNARVTIPAITLAFGGYRVRIAVGEGCPIAPAWYLLERWAKVVNSYTVMESSFGFNGVPEFEERSIRGGSFNGRICVVAHTPWTNCEPRAQYAMTFDGMDFGHLMAERKAELEADDAEGGE